MLENLSFLPRVERGVDTLTKASQLTFGNQSIHRPYLPAANHLLENPLSADFFLGKRDQGSRVFYHNILID
jgi:hypothetical protein